MRRSFQRTLSFMSYVRINDKSLKTGRKSVFRLIPSSSSELGKGSNYLKVIRDLPTKNKSKQNEMKWVWDYRSEPFSLQSSFLNLFLFLLWKFYHKHLVLGRLIYHLTLVPPTLDPPDTASLLCSFDDEFRPSCFRQIRVMEGWAKY